MSRSIEHKGEKAGGDCEVEAALMPYYDRDEHTLYLFHSVVALRVPILIDWGQARLALGITCPRHRAILRRTLFNLDCRLSGSRWHWWTRPLWGERERPPQICKRCHATVGPPDDPALVPFLARAERGYKAARGVCKV